MTRPFSWHTVGADPGRAAARFEEERVEMTLAAFGVAEARFELLDAHAARHGSRRLTFAGLRERFPTFPVLLEARYVGGVTAGVRRRNLFRLFVRESIEDRYLEAFARHAAEAGTRPLGLVLPFGHLRAGLVVHNGEFETGADRLTHTVSTGAPPHRLVAEPFREFLKYLAAGGWSPTSPPKTGLGTASAPPTLEGRLAPWMLARLGTGPAACVLGLLLAVLRSTEPGQRAWVRRTTDGGRCVCMPQEEMAAVFRISQSVLQRGLRQLRAEGLIETFRQDRRACVVVSCEDG